MRLRCALSEPEAAQRPCDSGSEVCVRKSIDPARLGSACPNCDRGSTEPNLEGSINPVASAHARHAPTRWGWMWN